MRVGPGDGAAHKQEVEPEDEERDVEAVHEAQLEVCLVQEQLHFVKEHLEHERVGLVHVPREPLHGEAHGLVGIEKRDSCRIVPALGVRVRGRVREREREAERERET